MPPRHHVDLAFATFASARPSSVEILLRAPPLVNVAVPRTTRPCRLRPGLKTDCCRRMSSDRHAYATAACYRAPRMSIPECKILPREAADRIGRGHATGLIAVAPLWSRRAAGLDELFHCGKSCPADRSEPARYSAGCSQVSRALPDRTTTGFSARRRRVGEDQTRTCFQVACSSVAGYTTRTRLLEQPALSSRTASDASIV